MDPYREASLSPILKKSVPKDFGSRLQKISADNLNSDDHLPSDLQEWLHGTVADAVHEIATTGATSHEMTYPWTNKPYMKKVQSWCKRHGLKCSFAEKFGNTVIVFSWEPWKFRINNLFLLCFNIVIIIASILAMFLSHNEIGIIMGLFNMIFHLIFAAAWSVQKVLK